MSEMLARQSGKSRAGASVRCGANKRTVSSKSRIRELRESSFGKRHHLRSLTYLTSRPQYSSPTFTWQKRTGLAGAHALNMASVAAVAVNQALTPERDDLGEHQGVPGKITSAIGTREELEVKPGDIARDDDEDDDVQASTRRRDRGRATHLDDEDAAEAGPGDDLFGDDDEALPDDPLQ